MSPLPGSSVCAASLRGAGAAGLPRPALIDFAHLERLATPHSALAAPQGFQPPPDLVTHRYSVAGIRLYAAVKDIAAHEKRTYPAAEYAAQLRRIGWRGAQSSTSPTSSPRKSKRRGRTPVR